MTTTDKQKAWIINSKNIQEPWHVTESPFYGNTRNEARTAALEDIRYDGLIDIDNEEIGLLNIRMKRAKEFDKILVDGEYKTVACIEYENKVKEHKANLEKILADHPNGYAYVRKGGSYYRPNSCGYTEFITRAGVYTVPQAVAEVKGCSIEDCMSVILIDIADIAEHNATINKEIEGLKTRLITP